MRLSDVCDIQRGYPARSRLEVSDDADGVPVMTVRNFDGDGAVRAESIERVKLHGSDLDHFFVGAGDVVFRSRGMKNTAFALSADFQQPSVAVFPLVVIKPKSNKIIPEYLSWLINSPKSQSYFDAKAQGVSMRMISKSTLDDLNVVIPDVHIQQKIVEIAELSSRESQLLSELAEMRARVVSASLTDMAETTPSR